MSKVRINGTDIELLLGKIVRPLWKRERYRKNVKKLPGKPDIVFPRAMLAIFADGDFWHGKDFKKWKKLIPDFWKKKISGNITRDKRQTKLLKSKGYKVLRFWGSSINTNQRKVFKKIKMAIKKSF